MDSHVLGKCSQDMVSHVLKKNYKYATDAPLPRVYKRHIEIASMT